MLRTLLLLILVLIGSHGIAAADPPDTAADDPACRRIAALIDESAALLLPVRVKRAFTLTLLAASDAAHKGEYAKALTLLRTFTFEVRGVTRAHRLRPEAADLLLTRAQEAIGALAPPQ